MPANTLNDMLLGFAVIFVILLVYIITLSMRTQRVKKQLEQDSPD